MKLQIFTIKKFLRWTLEKMVLNKDGDHDPKDSLKECKYVDKKVIRHINYDFEHFSDSDESDEE